jgi:hypothetical protein
MTNNPHIFFHTNIRWYSGSWMYPSFRNTSGDMLVDAKGGGNDFQRAQA